MSIKHNIPGNLIFLLFWLWLPTLTQAMDEQPCKSIEVACPAVVSTGVVNDDCWHYMISQLLYHSPDCASLMLSRLSVSNLQILALMNIPNFGRASSSLCDMARYQLVETQLKQYLGDRLEEAINPPNYNSDGLQAQATKPDPEYNWTDRASAYDYLNSCADTPSAADLDTTVDLPADSSEAGWVCYLSEVFESKKYTRKEVLSIFKAAPPEIVKKMKSAVISTFKYTVSGVGEFVVLAREASGQTDYIETISGICVGVYALGTAFMLTVFLPDDGPPRLIS
ncbi:MAG: hypothetical protein LBP33_00035, partial [Candidatus Adiutrix sp.]|nr:hypothetical protein [Candidatus Adiutrix sp.]